jgi:hypothetical protein
MGLSAAVDEAAALRGLARRLRPGTAVLAERILPIYRAESRTPPADDPDLLSDMTAVALAGLNCWLDVLEADRVVDQRFLHPVLDVIRRRATQGFSLDPMMRGYRIAARVLWEELLDLPAARQVLAPLSTRMLEFNDQLTTAAEQAHAAAALRGISEPQASGSALFDAVLAGRTRELVNVGGWLAAPHCVIVVDAGCAPGTEASAADLDDVAGALSGEVRAAYWTSRARPGSIVAACPIDGPDGRDVLIRWSARFGNARRPLTVAVGGIGEGVTGTQLSYREALDAMRVGGRLAGEPGRVHDSQRLGPLAMLLGDPERAKRFAHGSLHPLGRLAERSWVLPTLAAYLSCQGRLKEIAAQLAVHPSTVKYRLNELRPFLDAHASGGDQAAALLLAVRVREYFTDPPKPAGLSDPE